MTAIVSFITKQGWKILLALFLLAVWVFAFNSYTSSVKQSATLAASNETLTSTVKQSDAATAAVTGKLTKLDAISQEKTKDEAALRKDTEEFRQQLDALGETSGEVKDWASAPVPGPVLDRLRFATEAAGGGDEGSGGQRTQEPDSSR